MEDLHNFLDTFITVSKKPYEFLSAQDEVAEKLKDLIKHMYDYTKKNEELSDKNTLANLIVQNFDEEQIWQQLELQNESSTKSHKVIQAVSQLSAKAEKLAFPLKLKCIKAKKTRNKLKESQNVMVESETGESEDLTFSEKDVEREESDVGEESDFGEEAEIGEESDLTDDDNSDFGTKHHVKKGKLRPSVVDDKFFKLSELELFLQSEEKNQDKQKSENEPFDLFENMDNEAADYKYSDFFETPEGEDEVNSREIEEGDDHSDEDIEYEDDENASDDMSRNGIKRKHNELDDEDNSGGEDGEDEENKNEKSKNNKKVRFSLLGSDEEDSGSEIDGSLGNSKTKDKKVDAIKSSFELRQERLGRVIEKLEEEAVSEKPWQMKGEVTATVRPQNSLLEEVVDFDLSVRPAPVMTGEVTMRLEDIIMQRIKDKAWDDVERKVKPVETPSEFKKKLALDQEKSKLSLAEVYEKEFVKQREAASVDDKERQETEPALHVEVRSMLHSLFNKLDALSNYHYTPRPVAPEMKVISNVSAITMEEVAPVTVADSALLAPQEVKGKKQKGELKSKEEMTDTDKKRARRLKKTRQRQRQRDRLRAAKEISKINPGLGNKYSKLRAEKQVLDVTNNNNVTMVEESKEKTVKSSTAFFNKLQDEVKNQIKSKTTLKKKKNKWNITAKKLKL
ncbi:U3 small nucleolar ribonucleoprotein protein MPP10 isoform X1 [Homalodisca vitripennis]|nr:U3 small nucleolar ribonucleoprotein protein MPP10 isoform X1 [Homalodisca vitripennis]